MTGSRFLRTLACLCLCSAVQAQLPQTRITSVFPPGAGIGTSVDVTVGGGADLDELDQMTFSHPGISAVPKADANGNPVPNTFSVSVAADVPPGLYDARVRGLFGISNPRLFRVDALPEVAEVEPNNIASQATAVNLGSVINARANGATDVDFFRIPLKAGQTLVVRSEAARLDSPMQPLLQLFNAAGRRVAESRRIFSQEADLVITAAADEEYVLRVQDAVYSGGDQFVYRLVLDSRALVDYVTPAFVSRDSPTEVTLYGRHLPDGQPTEMKLAGQAIYQRKATVNPANGVRPIGAGATAAFAESFWWNGVDGNLLRFGTTITAPVAEVANAAEQTLTLPADVGGAFAERSDEDVYRFDAKKGDAWVLELYAQRLGSIADPLLMVEKINTAADGTVTYARVATEDDDRQNPGGADLPTLSDDPSFRLDVPEDGSYRVRLRDRYNDARGDARLQYRLSIRKPTPDFSLVVFDAFPSADGKAPATSGAVSLRKGGTYELTVYAYRRDGHNEAIEVHGDSLPAGISCRPSVIGAGQNVAKLVLTAAADAAEQVSPIQIQGTSGSAETQLKRSATVATLVHDAMNGLPRTARLAEQLVVGVMKDDQPFSIVTDIAAADYSQDQQLLIPVRLVKRNGFDGKVDLSFYNVPAETDAPAFAIEPGKDSAVARIYFKENAPVLSNTLLLQGTSAVPYRRNPWLAERAKARVTEAETALTAGQTRVTAAEAALTEQQKKVVELTEQVKKLGEELAAYTTQQQQLRDTYNKAVAEQVVSLQAVTKAQAQVAAVKAASDLPPDQLQAALQSLKAAADSLEAAAAGVEQQATAAEALAKQVAAVKEMEAVKAGEKTTAEAGVVQRMKDVEAAQAMLTTVAKELETAKAAKAAADESLKKAEEATKPNNLNVRVVSDAIVVRVHASPAKLAGALPDNGSIKRGASVAAKVTVTRKNNFTGPLKLQLVLPEGITSVKSDPVELAADQTEATLTVTAAADAPPGDLANVVIRATGELAGRAASTDLPVAVKIVE